MDAVIMLALRIGLLALLWVFVLVALNAMRRDTNKSAGAMPQPPKMGASPRSHAAVKQLSIVEGPLQGSHMNLGTLEECTLGRAADCDFVTGDDYSSGHHARLFRRGSEWVVEDLESRNGTLVNGVRIDQPEVVGANSEIKLGRTTVRLNA